MDYSANKLKEYIQLIQTNKFNFDFASNSAKFFNINKIKPELFIKNGIDERYALIIIDSLLQNKIMPEYYDDYTKKSFIELAINEMHSVFFIEELITLAEEHHLDVIGIASQILRAMIYNNYYTFKDIFKIMQVLFQLGYNYLDSYEIKDIFILECLKNSNKYSYSNYKKLLKYGSDNLLTRKDIKKYYQNIAINPKNIVKYLFYPMGEENKLKPDYILSIKYFFKEEDFDTILNYIEEIDFEITKDSFAYQGLKKFLTIVLSKENNFVEGNLYQLFCSLVIQKDMDLLLMVLNYYNSYHNFDFGYYGETLVEKVVNNFNKEDIEKLINELVGFGCKVENINIDLLKNKITQTQMNNYSNKETKKVDVNERKKILNNVNMVFKDFGTILNLQNYISMPGIGRDTELYKVYLSFARRNGSVILVGESGVGKTEIANRLAWQIQNNLCPDFLKDKIIVEVSLNNLIAGSTYRGMFEKKIKDLMEKATEYNVVLVINEIHNIYGLGTADEQKYDLSEALKIELDKGNIQVLGTTTEQEYQRYFANSALKRRFKKVDVKELDEGLLFSVYEKHINDLCILYDINIDNNLQIDKVIDILIRNTRKNCQVYNDRENNPSLGVSIIEDAFAYVRVMNKKSISITEFVNAFKFQDRLYESVKKSAVNELELLENTNTKGTIKVKTNIVDISRMKKNNKN